MQALESRSNPIEPAKMRTGDFALFNDERSDGYSSLLHAAYFVDGDVYFEKTDTESDYAYRFVSLSEIQTKISGLANWGMKTLFRKLEKQVPTAAAVFSISHDEMFHGLAANVPTVDRPFIVLGESPGAGGRPTYGLYRIGQLKIVIDPKTGRGLTDTADALAKRLVSALP
jgi:hypothetical protein